WERTPCGGRQPCAEQAEPYGKAPARASPPRGGGPRRSRWPAALEAPAITSCTLRRPVPGSIVGGDSARPRRSPAHLAQPAGAAMNLTKPRVLLLSLAIAAAVAACSNQPDEAPAASNSTTAAQDDGGLQLDEASLPGVNRFLASDLDTSVDACVDFAGHVNGKWLAANDIPGDRTSWGAFEMLDERSTAMQRQLAEQAAADEDAEGVAEIVGDFWATGMDVETINAQGIAPLQEELDEIAAIVSPEAIAGYLRERAAEGRNFLFGFGAEAV